MNEPMVYFSNRIVFIMKIIVSGNGRDTVVNRVCRKARYRIAVIWIRRVEFYRRQTRTHGFLGASRISIDVMDAPVPSYEEKKEKKKFNGMKTWTETNRPLGSWHIRYAGFSPICTS